MVRVTATTSDGGDARERVAAMLHRAARHRVGTDDGWCGACLTLADALLADPEVVASLAAAFAAEVPELRADRAATDPPWCRECGVMRGHHKLDCPRRPPPRERSPFVERPATWLPHDCSYPRRRLGRFLHRLWVCAYCGQAWSTRRDIRDSDALRWRRWP